MHSKIVRCTAVACSPHRPWLWRRDYDEAGFLVCTSWGSARSSFGFERCIRRPANRARSNLRHILRDFVASTPGVRRRHQHEFRKLTTPSDIDARHPSAPPPAANSGQRLKTIDDFALHDLEAVRLILRGGSVLDWHRLNFGKCRAGSKVHSKSRTSH